MQNKYKSSLIRKIRFFLIAVAFLLAGNLIGNWYQKEAPYEVFNEIKEPKPSKAIYSSRQAATTPESHENWTLIAFGKPYSDAAKAQLTHFIRIMNWLAGDPSVQHQIQLLFFSTDHTTSFKQLSDYVLPFHPKMTADKADEITTRKTVNFFHAINPDTDKSLYLLNPDQMVGGYFTTNDDPSKIAEDLKRIVNNN